MYEASKDHNDDPDVKPMWDKVYKLYQGYSSSYDLAAQAKAQSGPNFQVPKGPQGQNFVNATEFETFASILKRNPGYISMLPQVAEEDHEKNGEAAGLYGVHSYFKDLRQGQAPYQAP